MFVFTHRHQARAPSVRADAISHHAMNREGNKLYGHKLPNRDSLNTSQEEQYGDSVMKVKAKR